MAEVQSFDLPTLHSISELDVLDYETRLTEIRSKAGYIIDMDGVLYHGSKLLPGASKFIQWLQQNKKQFLFLTNNSGPTPRELCFKLQRLGVSGIQETQFYTSGMSTATFLKSQKPKGGSVYVIGEPGLTYALYEAGFVMNDTNPDYVIIGESTSHNFEKLTKACNLVLQGAKLIGTNSDVSGPIENGISPATGAFVKAIEMATNKQAFFCGKPTSLIMRYAQALLGTHKKDTCIIGDRMDTDILAGVTSQIDPVLVMSGVTTPQNLIDQAYRPFIVVNNVGDIVPETSSD